MDKGRHRDRRLRADCSEFNLGPDSLLGNSFEALGPIKCWKK